MDFSKKCIIGCVHLLPTVGAPLYNGDREAIYENALIESSILAEKGVDALIIENFRDRPHFPNNVPVETIATMAAVSREIKKVTRLPVGIAVLRNDARAAMGIAASVGADFIRVNVHVGNSLAGQGVLYGEGYNTIRQRKYLDANVEIYADAMVKHAKSLTYNELEDEIYDLNSICNGIVISGKLTGVEVDPTNVRIAKEKSTNPVIIGSGVTVDNIEKIFNLADGFIVGSCLKKEGIANNTIDPDRVERFMEKVNFLRSKYKY